MGVALVEFLDGFWGSSNVLNSLPCRIFNVPTFPFDIVLYMSISYARVKYLLDLPKIFTGIDNHRAWFRIDNHRAWFRMSLAGERVRSAGEEKVCVKNRVDLHCRWQPEFIGNWINYLNHRVGAG